MKQFMAFVRKEFYHILRDTRTMLILLGMPVVQIILFGFAISTEVKNTRMAVYDPSGDVVTQQIIERFRANNYFVVERMLHRPEQINEVLERGEASLVMVFNDYFGQRMLHTGDAAIQLIADGTDPNQASTLLMYAENIIAAYGQEQTQARQPGVQIVPRVHMLYNPQMKSAFFFVPGVMGLILMLICAMMTSVAIVREKETGTMEVLLASPIKPLYIIIAKTVPYFLLSIINLITILLLSVYVLQVPVAGSLFWLVVVSLVFILVALSIGILVSGLVRTQIAAMLISSMVMMMPVLLLSGMIYPIESMPVVLQWVSNIIPARWYIAAVKKLMIEGVSIIYVLKELSVLLVMGIVLLGVSLKKFKMSL